MGVRSAADSLPVPREAAAAGTKEEGVIAWDGARDLVLVEAAGVGAWAVPRPQGREGTVYARSAGTESRT